MKNIFYLLICSLISISDVSALADSTVIPTPRPVNHENYFYFYTKAEKHAPIYDLQKSIVIGTLPGDSLIRTALDPEEMRSVDQYISFESVPRTTQEKVIRGRIEIVYLGREVSDAPNPIDLEIMRQAEVVIGQIRLEEARQEEIENRKKLEKQMSLDDALQEFHSTSCSDSAITTETALKARWEKYIGSRMLTEEGKQLAKGASILDLVSRTILYETQREEALMGMHPGSTACQWDIIALSITNRAFYKNDKIRKAFGAAFLGDLTGVATDAQYNVWMSSKVANNRDLLACYLSSKYSKPKTRNLYKGIAHQIRDTLGLQKNGSVKEPELQSRFQVIGESSAPKLSEFTHYFHPGGMNKCNVNRNGAPTITNGYIRVIKVNKKTLRYDLEEFPVVNGQLVGQKLKDIRIIRRPSKHAMAYPLDIRSDDIYEFDMFVYENKRWVQIDSDEYFGGDAGIIGGHKYKEESPDPFHRSCLPEGVQPQCYSSTSDIKSLSSKGTEVPITWYKRDVLNNIISGLDDLGFVNPENNINIPKKTSLGNGRPIQIRCTSPSVKINNSFPSFGGACDKNIQLASEVTAR